MSNMKFIIWTLVAMFVMVFFFGRNPMDEVRQKKAKRAGERLIEKIEDSNKKKTGFGGMMSGEGAAPTGRTPGTVDWSAEGKAGGTPSDAAAGINNSVPRGTTYNSSPNPFLNTNPYIKPTPNNITAPNDVQRNNNANPRPQAPAGDGYYPPPPLRKGQGTFGPQSKIDGKELSPDELHKVEVANEFTRRKNSEHGSPNFTTDDGHSLAYFGTHVYTYAEDGSLRPMPDGKYPMFNGRWTMQVRNGQQTIANGDTAFWRQ